MAISVVMVAFTGSVLTGCSSSGPKPPPPPKPGPPFTYNIVLADTLQGEPIQVDVLKLGSLNRHFWETIAITNYFAPDSRVRADAPVIEKFNMVTGKTYTIDLSNPQFKAIRYPDVYEIAVLANVPPAQGAEASSNDPRRLLLPLDPLKWKTKWPDNKRVITITIKRSAGIDCDPNPVDKGQ